jgi:hypothetical protein
VAHATSFVGRIHRHDKVADDQIAQSNAGQVNPRVLAIQFGSTGRHLVCGRNVVALLVAGSADPSCYKSSLASALVFAGFGVAAGPATIFFAAAFVLSDKQYA